MYTNSYTGSAHRVDVIVLPTQDTNAQTYVPYDVTTGTRALYRDAI
jgi:hypothetical protein